MSKLGKYLEIALLAVLLTACDGKRDDNTGHVRHDASATQAVGQTILLLVW
ncbi:MAG: hypothetical protein ACSLEL_01065 [Candidatus Malihini olakiniferum]